MKKIICMLLILCFLPIIAFADAFDSFLQSWNKIAYIYNVPELSKDDFILQDDTYMAKTDKWKMIVVISNGSASQAAISSYDTDTFLPMVVTMGVTIVKKKTVDSYSQFRANVLDMYMRSLFNTEHRTSRFEDYQFTIGKNESEMIFTIYEQ